MADWVLHDVREQDTGKPMTKKGTVKQAATAPPNKPLNRSMHAARESKQDEFYTQLSDIEKELRHYTKHFKSKTVLCNCDDPKVSNFFHYFSHHFEKLKLKKLITTCYKNCDADLFSKHTDERGVYLEYDGDKSGNRVPDPDEIGIHKLRSNGDFRSDECIELLKQADSARPLALPDERPKCVSLGSFKERRKSSATACFPALMLARTVSKKF